VVKSTAVSSARESAVPDPASGWSKGLKVATGGQGVVAHAGVVLPRLLADRIGLTRGLRAVVARRGFRPLRDRGRLLSDAVAALVAGASCLSDVEALTRQEALFGPKGGASDTTLLRGLDEFADHLGEDGLPDRRLARMIAEVRASAWEQIVVGNQGRLPAVMVAGKPLTHPVAGGDDTAEGSVPVTVIRVDATIIEAATMKEPGVAGHYKGGIGYHPLTAWCTNTGDHLVVMQRPGNAGSFTAADHVKVLDAALAQIPSEHRGDILVTIDGAGASHTVIEHLTRWNTAKQHGRRGRRVEYSIGWPVDQRTRTAIEQLPENAWTVRLTADGRAEPKEQVADLTGLLRHSTDGDQLDSWPDDLRVIASRTRRGTNEQAALGEDAEWRHGAFATNTPAGQIQWLDARHRTQAHVENKIKELKAMGAEKLPTADQGRNAAWLQLAALAVTLTAWLRHLALDGDLKLAEPKTLRFRILNIPAKIVHHARSRILKIPDGWAWADDLLTAWDRLQALHPG
jgi:Transposase DDE domain group 1